MTYYSTCLSPLSAHKSALKPDMIIYCHNRFIALGLEQLILDEFPSLRVMTLQHSDAVESIIRSLPDTKIIAILSEGRAEALAQFRTVLHLQRGSQLQLMMLAGTVSVALQPLLTSAQWLSFRASREHILKEILIWLRSPAPFLSPAPLSRLTSRQLAVLFMLANGIKNHEVATTFGISVKTVSAHRHGIQTRLGISCWADWLLFCAAVSEHLKYSDRKHLTSRQSGYQNAVVNY